MKLTIIKEDNMVYVDQAALSVDCSDLPENFHALQWDGTTGHVEFVGHVLPNETITDISIYQVYVDRWNEAKAKQLENEAKAKQLEEQNNSSDINS